MSPRRTRSSWKRLVAEAARSGSIAKTARRHGVKAKTLAWWRWNLRGETSTKPLPRVLPVSVSLGSKIATMPVSIEISVRDVTLRVSAENDVRYVAALVAAVRAAC